MLLGIKGLWYEVEPCTHKYVYVCTCECVIFKRLGTCDARPPRHEQSAVFLLRPNSEAKQLLLKYIEYTTYIYILTVCGFEYTLHVTAKLLL